MPELQPEILEAAPKPYKPWLRQAAPLAFATAILMSAACSVERDGGHQLAEPIPAEAVEPTKAPAKEVSKKPAAKKVAPAPDRNVTIRGAYRRRSTGPMVRKIEQALDDIGCDVGSKRNWLDNVDIKSIKIFQGNYGFDPIDGIPGERTRLALFAGAVAGNKNCARRTPYKPVPEKCKDPLVAAVECSIPKPAADKPGSYPEECKDPDARLLLAGLCEKET